MAVPALAASGAQQPQAQAWMVLALSLIHI